MPKFKKKTTEQIQREIASKIIRQMESAGTNWLRSWAVPQGDQPTSMSTGKPYNGINWLILGIERAAKGYASGQWATYKQWESRGAQVRRGEKGTQVVLYKPIIIKEKQDDGTTEEKNVRLLRSFTVFNADQVDGYEAPTCDDMPNYKDGNPETLFDTIAKSVECEVRHENIASAFCEGRGAYVNMPFCNQFDSPEGYAATGFHELVHWTGATSRLDRESFTKYARMRAEEELVAELGAAMLCGVTGVSPEPREDHATYLNSWLASIKKDPKAIFRAAAKASAASTYIVETSGFFKWQEVQLNDDERIAA